MTWETQQLFFVVDHRLLSFVFFATLATYFFHGIVNTVYPPESSQHAWNHRNKKWIILALALTLLATMYVVWPFLNQPLPFVAVALAAFLYTAPNLPWKIFRFLQSIAIGKTVYLAMVWTIVTTMLPMWISGMEPPELFWWFLGHRFFLLLAICILFDQRDFHPDQKKGVRSMATMTNGDTLGWIFHISMVLSGTMGLGIQYSLINPWLIPVLLLLPQFSKKPTQKHDAYYSLFLDGMMAFTALLHALLTFAIFR
jgi:4-hydroxybenzoate polyprenyltransferase